MTKISELHQVLKCSNTLKLYSLPKWHTSTWIRPGHYVDTSKTKFWQISTSCSCTFWCNFNGRKTSVVSTYFSRCNLSGRNMHVFLLTFFDAILMGKNSTLFLVSCKLMKTFEKVFSVFVTLNSWLFGQLLCCEVTLVKKCNKPLLQKSETKVFDQKRFIKNLLKVSEKNNSGVSRINQIMSKLLILSKRLQFWTCRAFSHFTFNKPLVAFY